MKRIFSVLTSLVFVIACCAFFGCNDDKNKNCFYDIACVLNGDTLTGRETFTFFNSTDEVFKELKFNLFMNAYREDSKFPPVADKDSAKCYYKGKSYGETNIERVQILDDIVQFEIKGQDNNILVVPLSAEVFPQEQVSVTIDFSVKLAEVISRTGINEQTINLGNFYPILCGIEDNGFYECNYYSIGDPFFSDCADYKVKLTLDEEYVVASSGKLRSQEKNDNMNSLTYSLENARSFCFVLSKEFEMITDSSLGVEINYYYLQDKTPKKSLDIAVDSLRTFTELYGEYGYKTLSIVETPFNQGGMEYTALVYISNDLEPKAYQEVIVHEIAHQWWQVMVGNNEVKYGFLDEGLAEYSVVLFYENNPKYNINRNDLIKSAEKTYRVYCSVFDKLYGSTDTSMLRCLDEFKSEYEYVNIAYIKGCLLHEYLRTSVGDEKYFKGVKKYFKDYCFKVATPFDLQGTFENIGLDTNGFFDSFYNGKVIL